MAEVKKCYLHRTFDHAMHGRAFHLMADTSAELAEAASQIGLNPAWIQKAGTEYEHYDVMGRFIPKAFSIASEISDREAVGLIWRKRRSGVKK